MILDEKLESERLLWDFIDNVCDGWTKEWVLYLYYSANYYKKEAFLHIIRLVEDNGLPQVEPIMNLLLEANIYEKLSDAESKQRFILNHEAFTICVQMFATEMAEHILTNSLIILN